MIHYNMLASLATAYPKTTEESANKPLLFLDKTGKFTQVDHPRSSTSLKVIAAKLNNLLNSGIYSFIMQNPGVLQKFLESKVILESFNHSITSINKHIAEHNTIFANNNVIIRCFLTILGKGKINPIACKQIDNDSIVNMYNSLSGIEIIYKSDKLNYELTEKCNFGSHKSDKSEKRELDNENDNGRFLAIDSNGRFSITTDKKQRSSLKNIACQMKRLFSSDLVIFCKLLTQNPQMAAMRSSFRKLLRRVMLINSQITEHNKKYDQCNIIKRLYLTLHGCGRITNIGNPATIFANSFIKSKALNFAKIVLQSKMLILIKEIGGLEKKLISTPTLLDRQILHKEAAKLYENLAELDTRATSIGCKSLLHNPIPTDVALPSGVALPSALLLDRYQTIQSIPLPPPLSPPLSPPVSCQLKMLTTNLTQQVESLAHRLQRQNSSSSSLTDAPIDMLAQVKARLAEMRDKEKQAARKAAIEAQQKSKPETPIEALRARLAQSRPNMQTDVTNEDSDSGFD